MSTTEKAASKINRLGRVTKKIVKKIKHVSRQKIANSKYILMIDDPKRPYINSKNVVFDGWIVPKGSRKITEVRIINNKKIFIGKYGIKRPDVKSFYSEISPQKTLYSGFSVGFEFEDGKAELQVKLDKKYITVFSTELMFTPDDTILSILNPDLAENMAEHTNLLQNKQKYFYEKEVEGSYKAHQDDPRLVAMYLPQFHPIKQNNEVWGRGFTEWTNVTKATAKFIGHQQPLLPSDLGFYDLRLEENIKDQIDIAKKHGLFGFCFYYYWFSGQTILDKPLNTFLQHKEWDFNFMICWANENWTKRWDGRDNDIIISQKYLDSDPLEFIKSVASIITDERYIQEDGKPILMVYRASDLKNPSKYASLWREYIKTKYKKDIKLVAVISFDDKDPREYGFDAALDFAPLSSFFKTKIYPNQKLPYVDKNKQLLDVDFEGSVVDYREIALNKEQFSYFDFPTYRCVMPSWDNDARKKGKGFVFYNSNPDIYQEWLNKAIQSEKNIKNPIVFINAWNEWAEGAMLEPSQHLGRAVLNRTAEVLARHSKHKGNQLKFIPFGIKKHSDLAVIVHLYFTEKWEYIKEALKNIEEPYDLHISLNDKDKDFKGIIRESHPTASVYIVPNRGRDVLPFVHIARRLKTAGYKYFLKLHSKKSKHRSDGHNWFEELVDALIPSREITQQIMTTLQKEDTIIGPSGHYVALSRHLGSNRKHIDGLAKKIYGKTRLDITRDSGFFAGTMFWGTFEAIDPLLSLYLSPEDFEPEMGQIDGTMAHAVERIIVDISSNQNKKSVYGVSSSGLEKINHEKLIKNYLYVK